MAIHEQNQLAETGTTLYRQFTLLHVCGLWEEINLSITDPRIRKK